MTDDLVKRLRDLADCAVDVAPYETMLQAADRIEELERQTEELSAVVEELIDKDAADRIERLERAVLDLAQHTSKADLCFYIQPTTRKVLNEIEEKLK